MVDHITSGVVQLLNVQQVILVKSYRNRLGEERRLPPQTVSSPLLIPSYGSQETLSHVYKKSPLWHST